MSVPVIVWADELGVVSRIEAAGTQASVVRHTMDLEEVLAQVSAGIARSVVLAGPSQDVDATFADPFLAIGGRAIALSEDPVEILRLQRLGLLVMPLTSTGESLVRALQGDVDPAQHAGGSAPPGGPLSDDAERRGGVPAPGADGRAPHDRHGEAADAWDKGGARAGLPDGAPAQSGSWASWNDGGTVGVGPPAADSQTGASGADPWEVPGASPAQQAGRERAGAGRGVPGRIVVVWGPAGAPGRSLVALNLAAELAAEAWDVALVDADTHAASQAGMLGLLQESAGLVRLCRAVDAGTFDPDADSEAFARVQVGSASFRLTSGLPRPERWAEAPGPAVKRALRAVAACRDIVIVDVGASIESDLDLAMDTFAPQRNDAVLAALAVADEVLVVGQADSVGLPRLIHACEEFALLPDGPVPSVVVNKVRTASVGARPERMVRRAWERFGPAGLPPQAFLPWDPDAADAALLAGTTLEQAAPHSPLRAGIADLARRIGTRSTQGGVAAAGTGIDLAQIPVLSQQPTDGPDAEAKRPRPARRRASGGTRRRAGAGTRFFSRGA